VAKSSKPATPATPKEYLASLPGDRRAAMGALRKVILDHLPKGYEEGIASGMLNYVVPLSVCPETYNGQPLMYVSMASQKNYMTVHLLPLYGDRETEGWFRDQFAKRGMKLDMGKACVRFKSLDDLPLDVIGMVVAKFPVDKWVSVYRQSRTKASSRKATSTARGTRAARARAR
jgi:hypothetical protein